MTRSRHSEFSVSLHSVENQAGGPLEVRRSAPIDDLRVTSAMVPDGAEVTVEAVIEPVHGGVLVTGWVSAPWTGECARCLEGVRGTMRSEVRELFERGGGPDDMTYPLGVDEVDLEPMVREQCVLGLPMRPLCRRDCRGLCPRCGHNLNEGGCGCPPERDSPFSVLDELLGGNEVPGASGP